VVSLSKGNVTDTHGEDFQWRIWWCVL